MSTERWQERQETRRMRAECKKRCYRCKRWKPWADFYRNVSMPDGLQNECRECRAAVNHGVPYRMDLAPVDRWDIDARIASIEARTADDDARGFSAFTPGAVKPVTA